jgi:nidogen-like/carboxypeptidase family protein
MRRTVVVVLVAMAALLLTCAPALAAPGVVQNLPECNANTLAANDDGFTGTAVPLGFNAQMFDTGFSDVFVNNNGNVTVGEGLSDFTPFDFRESGQTMIAPFFADVDTRGSGSGLVHYGQVPSYGGQKAFCVIWDNVGYYASHADKRNRFQLIIVDQGAAGIDLVFNYDSIAWETGDASDGTNGFGGTSAVAGYAAGDGDAAHALMLPGSFVNGGLLDSNASTSLAGHATAGQPAGRYVFQLRQGAATGGRLTGTVTDPGDDPVAGAVVQICPAAGGACVTRVASSQGIYTASNLPAGNYNLTAFPGPGDVFTPARVNNVAVGGPGTTKTQDLQLGDPPSGPPAGTTITNIGIAPGGLPIAYWSDPLALVTQGCPGAAATYQVRVAGHVVRNGALTEGPAGTYSATIAPLIPNSGDGLISVHFDCPADPDEDIEFGIYIDPSGVVRDENGNPAGGATVTLLRSAAAAGPFFPVPDGDAVMSPANRDNPFTTEADGRFGWDVVAGFYVVKASKPGCVSAQSAVMSIPPPVTNLDLRLDCRPPATGGGGQTTTTTNQSPTPPTLAKIGKVKLRKGKLTVPLTCLKSAITACAGKVTVKLTGKVVAHKSYKKLKPGKTAKLTVALSKKGRASIAKLKHGKKFKLSVSATVKDAAGKGATAKKTVTLRR